MTMGARLGMIALAAVMTFGCGNSSNDGAESPGGQGGQGGEGSSGSFAAVPPTTDKVDLLLMVDNSISMADKQALLQEAVPRLISRLVNPSSGQKPVEDLHVGVITSSLGGHGSGTCNPDTSDTADDRAHLLPSVRQGLTSHQGLGFLWWDPAQKSGGEASLSALVTAFTGHVQAAGETGCGLEASLEAWYRFLIDPSPPASITKVSNLAQAQGVDSVLLAQRKDFLRPDSALAIVMLSDENDCSILDGGVNWIAAEVVEAESGFPFHLARGTSACTANPNDPCCRSCASLESAPPTGCGPIETDLECQKGNWDDVGDHPNVRCWNQKQRFGMDFLYPTRKYAEALTQATLCPAWTNDAECAGERVQNPLFAGGRDPTHVFLTGIVGVPWQDLATTDTLHDPGALELIDSRDLGGMGRWTWLAPVCLEDVAPSELPRPLPICKRWNLTDSPNDPFMIESTAPRSGVNPATQDPIASPSSGPMANGINGHDWNTAGTELEYACIFPLAKPRDCTNDDPSCYCHGASGTAAVGNPLCQSSSGDYSEQQLFAKAYPGTRQLQVLRDIGKQAVVASICPKSITGATSSAYGYNAAMDALAEKLAPVLK